MSGSLTYGTPLPVAEVKAAGDGWEVAGYASTWDRDLGGDVVAPGAFATHLAGGAKVRFLYAHDPAQVLGRPLELREDDRGLFGRFRISQTRLGQDVHRLLVDGALDSFSIGFVPRDFDRDEKAGVRTLKAVELVECSVVAMPMNPAATVTAVKAADYATLSPEELLDTYDIHRSAILARLDGALTRRLAEGRKLADSTLAMLERLRVAAETDAATLLRLATTPPTPKPTGDDSAPVETAGLVESHLRRARLRELGRLYGVSMP